MAREPLATRSHYRHWQTIALQWSDNDVYGHVNNAVHYRWFDTVVNDWLISRGLLDIHMGDPIGLVVETGCRYAGSVSYPGVVEIGMCIRQIGTSSVVYQLGLFAEGASDAAAQGTFTHVYVARESRRPAPLPPLWRKVLRELVVC